MNKATQVWLAFDLDRGKGLRRAAAQLICRYAYQAARSGIPIPKLNDYPAIWIEPFERIAARFRLFDFGAAILRAYYADNNPNTNTQQAYPKGRWS